MALQFSSIVDQVRANKDRSLTLKLETQELPVDETSQIFDLMTKQIWVAMAEVPIEADDVTIPDVLPEFKGDKSPSERLRAVLYRAWEQGSKDKTFPLFYENYMHKLIESIKEKLN